MVTDETIGLSVGSAFSAIQRVLDFVPERRPGPLTTRERELRTMPYEEYLQTTEWGWTRWWAIGNAHSACELCGETERLVVHHLTYVNRGRELARDLLVVCDRCHAAVHNLLTPKAEGRPRMRSRREREVLEDLAWT